jgi:polysaccharide biosynthesis/export protein
MRPILLSLCLCLALTGCLSGPEASPPAQADVLAPGDGLRITVAGEEELSGGFVVNSDGNVRLGLLGAVPAAGLSPAALQEKLRQLLAAGYLKNPQVLVERVAPSSPDLRPSQAVQ